MQTGMFGKYLKCPIHHLAPNVYDKTLRYNNKNQIIAQTCNPVAAIPRTLNVQMFQFVHFV